MSKDYNPYSTYKSIHLNQKNEIYKDSRSIIKEKIYPGRIIVILYYSIKIYLFYSIFLINCKQKNYFFVDSVIQLKIKGYGNMNILSNDYRNLPNKILIDEKDEEFVQREYNFENSENKIYNVSLIWNNDIIHEISNMFKGCSNITEIDFINFNTSDIYDISSMFDGCTSLTHLNLSKFNTYKVGKYDYLFRDCSSLTSLDLSNFDVSRASGFDDLFSGCSSLKYLDISNFKTYEFIYGSNIFLGCTSLEYLNLKSTYLHNSFMTQISDLSSTNLIICSIDNVWETNFPIIHEIFCYNNSISSGTYNNSSLKCYTKQDSNKLNAHFCEICGKNYYQLYNDIINNDSSIFCYKSPIGFYLDKDDFLYKECFSSCKSCEIIGNNDEHNCLECKDEYNYIIIKSNYNNCYNNNFYTSTSEIKSNLYTYNITTDILNNYHYSQLDFLHILFDDLNLIDIDNGIDKKIKKNNLEFIFTSTDNQKNNEDKINITMNLGHCEKNLKMNMEYQKMILYTYFKLFMKKKE